MGFKWFTSATGFDAYLRINLNQRDILLNNYEKFGSENSRIWFNCM